MWNYSTGTVPASVNGGGLNSVYADRERGIFLMFYTAREYACGEQLMGAALQLARARLERMTGSGEERVREALTLANNEVVTLVQSSGVKTCPASMLVAVLLTPTAAVLGQIGDLTFYEIKADQVRKVVMDSPPFDTRCSVKGNEVSGEMVPVDSVEKACVVGLRAHEPDDDDFVTVTKLDVGPDSALLICSNNLAGGLPEADILRVVRSNPGNRTRLVHAILDAADVAGDFERTSVLFIEGSTFARALRESRRRSLS